MQDLLARYMFYIYTSTTTESCRTATKWTSLMRLIKINSLLISTVQLAKSFAVATIRQLIHYSSLGAGSCFHDNK